MVGKIKKWDWDFLVSISSPSSEGGGFVSSVFVLSLVVFVFPLVLLQAKVVGWAYV